MIYGIGIDLLDVRRIAASLSQHGDRFAQRILHPDEFAEYVQRGGASAVRGQRYVASRFAAKEAFSKAWGSGIGEKVSFQGLSVMNNAAGAPLLLCHGALEAERARAGLKTWISLSDEGDFVIAQVVIESA